MRTIKFRGKRLYDGEWVYGYPLMVDTEKFKSANIVTFDRVYPDTLAKVTTSVDFNTLGQFTGCSIDGVDIYEGDILRCHYDRKVKTGVVVYFQGSFGLTKGNPYELFEDMHEFFWGSESGYRIIGNIHDNPELLEEKS